MEITFIILGLIILLVAAYLLYKIHKASIQTQKSISLICSTLMPLLGYYINGIKEGGGDLNPGSSLETVDPEFLSYVLIIHYAFLVIALLTSELKDTRHSVVAKWIYLVAMKIIWLQTLFASILIIASIIGLFMLLVPIYNLPLIAILINGVVLLNLIKHNTQIIDDNPEHKKLISITTWVLACIAYIMITYAIWLIEPDFADALKKTVSQLLKIK